MPAMKLLLKIRPKLVSGPTETLFLKIYAVSAAIKAIRAKKEKKATIYTVLLYLKEICC